MNLQDLLCETPIFKNSDLKMTELISPFYSENSIKREFEFIGKGKLDSGDEYWVIIKKSLDLAVIGIPGLRDSDKKPGMKIVGEVEFKRSVTFSGLKSIDTGKNIIQVNLAQVPDKYRIKGYGFYLYLTLAKAGYVVISDNTQYIGGKELWKKIAKNVLKDKYAVYIIDHGAVLVDLNGEPIVYDGDNIDDSKIWSSDSDKKYTLFALRSKI